MKRYQVVLEKVRSTHNNLRTDKVEGVTLELPKKGEYFSVVGESLTPGATARVVTTTEIQNVEQMGDEYMFTTMNSTYKLTVVKEMESSGAV